MTIFLDFDGTIIDVREKYNQVYSSLREGFELPIIEYWSWRKQFQSLQEAILSLGLEKSAFNMYKKSWNDLIESELYLRFDETLVGVPEKLTELSRIGSLVLCTSRRNEKNLSSQLDDLDLKHYFSDVLVSNVDSKAARIKQFLSLTAGKEDFNCFFGDTTSDMVAAKVSGLIACGVLSGLGSERELVSSGAKLIFCSLSQVDVETLVSVTVDG